MNDEVDVQLQEYASELGVGVRFTLRPEEEKLFGRLSGKLAYFRSRNRRKWDYYEGKQPFRNLGVAIPHSLNNEELRATVSWPEIVVDSLAERLEWQGWISTSDDIAALNQIFMDNDLDIAFSKVALDALVTGVGFFVATATGDSDSPVAIDALSSMSATFEWDEKLNRVAAGLSERVDAEGNKIQTLYLPDVTIDRFSGRSGERVQVYEHGRGRCSLIVVPNRSRAGEMEGRSEISRAIEYYTDHGTRTMLGMEYNREFYTTPQRYLLNVAPEDIGADEAGDPQQRLTMGWQVAQSQALVVPPGEKEDPEVKVGQFAAASPAPYIDELKMLAQMVSAHSGVPASYLGFSSENPPSADAIRASESRLVKRAELRQKLFRQALRKDLAFVCQSILDGKPADRGFIASLDVVWREASTPTLAATMDAMVKAAQAKIVPPASSVVLNRIGFSATEQEIIRKEQVEQQAAERMAALSTLAQTRGSNESQGYDIDGFELETENTSGIEQF